MERSKHRIEIERKFLIKGPLDSSIITGSPNHVHRYYIHTDHHIDLRVQQKNEGGYELERRIQDPTSPLRREGTKIPITKSEFDRLKSLSVGNPIHYLKHQTKFPKIFIKEYTGQLSGLIIVEAEFETEEDAHEFRVEHAWMGQEISDSPYSRDSGLIAIASWQELRQKFGL